MTLHISSVFTYDEDAGNYIQAVEAADGQALESATRKAINNFVIGCKQDGIWDAIKASCILAGARTTNGALIPLKGTAPTPYNFDLVGDTDYDRKTGLKGDGSTKYLDSKRNNNADPQNSRHLSLYATSINTIEFRVIAGTSNVTGRTSIVQVGAVSARISSSAGSPPAFSSPIAVGFFGGTRPNSAQVIGRNGGVNITAANTSEVPVSVNLGIFANELGGTACNARLAFYSIGESLDLAKLDARVTDLITAFGAAIP